MEIIGNGVFVAKTKKKFPIDRSRGVRFCVARVTKQIEDRFFFCLSLICNWSSSFQNLTTEVTRRHFE